MDSNGKSSIKPLHEQHRQAPVRATPMTDPDYDQATTTLELDPTTSRWHVRANSISDCVDKLTEVWNEAAAEASSSSAESNASEEARADPRLAGHMPSP